MKQLIVTVTLALSGCTVAPGLKGTTLSEPACTDSCSEKFERCPQMFSAFPERGVIECPAARQQCLRACAKHQSTVAQGVTAAPVSVTPVTAAPVNSASSSEVNARIEPASATPPPARQSMETKLRELKHLHDEGLVSDEVYIERQKAILSEP